MMMHTSETFKEGRLKKTSALNQTIVSSGMKELLSVSNNLNFMSHFRNTNLHGSIFTLALDKCTQQL